MQDCSSSCSRLGEEQLEAMDCLLESFCSTRTAQNTHATRVVSLLQLYYSDLGSLEGGGLELVLPDTARIVRWRSGVVSGFRSVQV